MGGRSDADAREPLAQWPSAWRGLRANPLPAYWWLAEQRSTAKQRWWARSPGLLIAGVLISAIATLGEVTLLREMLWVSGSVVGTPAYARSVVLYGLIILAGGAGSFAYLWLLARCYQLLYTALGFLGTGTGRPPPVSMDDELAASPQTDQEIVVGFASFGLRKMLPPLVVVCASIGLLKFYLDFTPLAAWGFDGGAIARQYGAIASAGVAIALTAELLVSGTLAALTLMLLCMPLSLGRRTVGGSAIGALTLIAAQPLLVGGVVWLRRGLLLDTLGGDYLDFQLALASSLAWLLAITISIMAVVARGNAAARLVLRYGLGLTMVVVVCSTWYMAVAASGVPDAIRAALAAPYQAVVLVSPMLPLDPLVAAAQETPDGAVLFAQLEHWLIGLGIQLLIVVALAHLARAAVRARRGGTA